MSNLDYEWLLLIAQAKHLGITIEEIKAFIQSNKEGKESNAK